MASFVISNSFLQKHWLRDQPVLKCNPIYQTALFTKIVWSQSFPNNRHRINLNKKAVKINSCYTCTAGCSMWTSASNWFPRTLTGPPSSSVLEEAPSLSSSSSSSFILLCLLRSTNRLLSSILLTALLNGFSLWTLNVPAGIEALV